MMIFILLLAAWVLPEIVTRIRVEWERRKTLKRLEDMWQKPKED